MINFLWACNNDRKHLTFADMKDFRCLLMRRAGAMYNLSEIQLDSNN